MPSISRSSLPTSLRHVLIDLQDLQLGLGDLALGLRHRRDQLSALAVEPRRLALERGEAGDLDQVLAPEVAHALELLLDQLDLLGLGVLLRGQAGDLLLELDDPLAELLLLAVRALRRRLEQFALAVERVGRRRDRSAGRQAPSGILTLSAPSRSASSRALRA